MKQRRKLLGEYPQNKDELKQLNKDITKAARADIRKFINKWVTKGMEETKSMRVLRNELSTAHRKDQNNQIREWKRTSNKKQKGNIEDC
ncbi:unnamed protein product [Ceutorhynchus assimilis]|uniref:Uncharacterized protein n=1 Tax=Ceutorhynchus assimilis TaxID=467358 RepID=A0A9N9MG57_9CUCU|nr:unnamed protein product [Ceutorhynchus assimilis]